MPVDGRTARLRRLEFVMQELKAIPQAELDATIVAGALLEVAEILAEEIAISPERGTNA